MSDDLASVAPSQANHQRNFTERRTTGKSISHLCKNIQVFTLKTFWGKHSTRGGTRLAAFRFILNAFSLKEQTARSEALMWGKERESAEEIRYVYTRVRLLYSVASTDSVHMKRTITETQKCIHLQSSECYRSSRHQWIRRLSWLQWSACLHYVTSLNSCIRKKALLLCTAYRIRLSVRPSHLKNSTCYRPNLPSVILLNWPSSLRYRLDGIWLQFSCSKLIGTSKFRISLSIRTMTRKRHTK